MCGLCKNCHVSWLIDADIFHLLIKDHLQNMIHRLIIKHVCKDRIKAPSLQIVFSGNNVIVYVWELIIILD